MENVKNDDCILKDTGVRKTIGGGASREITGKKGRCDLLPPQGVLNIVSYVNDECVGNVWRAFESLLQFQIKKNTVYLQDAFCYLVTMLNWSSNFEGQGDEFTEFNESVLYKHQGDLTNSALYANMFLLLAKHYEQGALKYGARNWEKGLGVGSCIDSAMRHILKFMGGWRDGEPHIVAAAWNILALIHEIEVNPKCLKEYDWPLSSVPNIPEPKNSGI